MTEIRIDRWSHPAAILVATDLNDLDRLMPFAIEQATQTGARLALLHVLSLTEAMAADAAGLPYYDQAGAVDSALKTLETWCELARRKHIVCDAIVREGSAASQILTAVRQFQADRVLLGTRSRGKVSKLLLGSVAEQVLRSVHIPVMTVGPEAHPWVGSSDSEPLVLHATTLRETSRPSAALACHIAFTRGAKLELLHVLPAMDEIQHRGQLTGLDAAAMQQLRALTSSLACEGDVEIATEVLHGNPAIEILAEASLRNASLIVLGSTNRSTFQNLTRDRTVYKVLAHARCPVMTLREPASQVDEPIAAHAAAQS